MLLSPGRLRSIAARSAFVCCITVGASACSQAPQAAPPRVAEPAAPPAPPPASPRPAEAAASKAEKPAPKPAEPSPTRAAKVNVWTNVSDVKGSLSVEDALRVMLDQKAKLRDCYAAEQDQAAGARVSVRVKIAPDGSVRDLATVGEREGDLDLIRCALDTVRTSHFPPQDEDDTEFVFEVRYQPPGRSVAATTAVDSAR